MNKTNSYWYEPILPSESTFPLSCRRTLTDFIASVSSHLARKRTADTFLAFLTNSSSMIIVFLSELSTAFETIGSTTAPEQTIDQYLELFPESSLANVLADQQQRKKLNMIADDVLSGFLEQKAYSFAVSKDFLREILAGVIFQSMMTSFSRPEFINGWIVYLLSGEGESEIMSAIDAGVEGARNQGVTAPKSTNSSDGSSLKGMSNIEPSPRVSSERTSHELDNSDKATEEAVIEAKRLSAMIAAQDAHRQDTQKATNNDQLNSKQMVGDMLPLAQKFDAVEGLVSEHLPRKGSEDSGHVLDINEAVSQHAQASSASSQGAPSSPSKSDVPTPETTHAPFLALHGASVSVDDDLQPGDKALIRSKPTSNYLIQVEPTSARCTGWMTFKKYADFESLHGTLETISRLNRIRSFAEAYPVLPQWKGHTKQDLARNLERYLQDALQHEPLADSEKMRRFLEKDNRLGTESTDQSTKAGFSFPSQTAFENMGKGVLDVLSNAPKGVAGGGKAVFGGVTGVFGSVGGNNKRLSRSFTGESDEQSRSPSASNVPVPARSEQTEDSKNWGSSLDLTRDSQHRKLSVKSIENPDVTPLHSPDFDALSFSDAGLSQNSAAKLSSEPSIDNQPQDMEVTEPSHPTSLSGDSKGNEQKDNPVVSLQERQSEATANSDSGSAKSPNKAITHDETQISVELIFAVINELYTLSSAWNIRRTLLNAAKSYILRPGSPTLETIRALLQDSVIDANTSDDTIGMYLAKLRENALPTEAELKNWPPPPSDAEKERLRENARRLLIQKGLPQALTSVMGAVASREALGKIFDCLQVETIARGFVFSILLQALRAVII